MVQRCSRRRQRKKGKGSATDGGREKAVGDNAGWKPLDKGLEVGGGGGGRRRKRPAKRYGGVSRHVSSSDNDNKDNGKTNRCHRAGD